jgi:hypothetical protein
MGSVATGHSVSTGQCRYWQCSLLGRIQLLDTVSVMARWQIRVVGDSIASG